MWVGVGVCINIYIVCVYIYIYIVCVRAQATCDTRSIFKQSLAVSNPEFFFETN